MPLAAQIQNIAPDAAGLQRIAEKARAEGYSFVDRLLHEAQSGANRFDGAGECFLGLFMSGVLIGCGGLNRDPFVGGDTGRLRHIYVSPDHRRQGLARCLVAELLRRGRPTFSMIRLRVADEAGRAFYEALGFSSIDEPSATHEILF